MDKTFDNVVKLIEAGFTKSEIDAMLMPIPAEPEPAEPREKPEPTPAPEPVKDEPKPEEPVEAPAVPEVLTSFMDEVRASLGELTRAVQAKNINTMSTPTQTAEDMNDFLAAYINPPKQSK